MFPLDAIADWVGGQYGYDDYEPRDRVCPRCGTKLSEFVDSGFVGCSQCYRVFKEDALELAANVHGRTAHIGKTPPIEATKAAKKREIERLEAEKERASRAEDYLRANELKLQIDRLRREL